jgi:hypothetical protein
MRKLLMLVIVVLLTVVGINAQTKLKGIVKVAGTEAPIQGAKVTLLQQNLSTQTNEKGEFSLSYIEAGDEELSIAKDGYFAQIKLIKIRKDVTTDLGVLYLIADTQAEAKLDIVMQLNENELDDAENGSGRGSSTMLNSKDVYTNKTSYSFSPMRFNVRGYEQAYESTYINGISFNGLERGGFNYSMLGGLSDATKYKDEFDGLQPNSYSFGGIGGSTNINMLASAIPMGSKIGVANSNRSYKYRTSFMHSTGLMNNGWAFAASGVIRYANEGINEGTFYNSAAYFLSAEKRLNDKHTLSAVTFGAPTKRGQSSPSTQEAYYLTNSIYYNSYWGYQNGKKRNSRVVNSYDPTIILNHDFKIDQNKRLRSGLAFHYSMYSNSALTFFNAPDPRPDYYRNMPSYQFDGQVGLDGYINGQPNSGIMSDLTNLWKSRDPQATQIDWNWLYQSNYRNNAVNPTGNARYALERRHNNLMETMLNTLYTHQLNKSLKITVGVDAKYSKGIHYKTMDDLLGANQWIDIDQFAERDLTGNLLGKDPIIVQNNTQDPNRIIGKGDIFGYNYSLDIVNANIFAQNEWKFSSFELFYALKISYSEFSRFGKMENGRAVVEGVQSFGRGKKYSDITPSVKLGGSYLIDNHNKLVINGLYENRSPIPTNAYISPRIKDTFVKGLIPEEVISADISYQFNYRSIKGRITAFNTLINNGVDLSSYYDESNRTFVNHSLTGIDKSYKGIELGVSVKLNSSFTLSLAGTVAEYIYTDTITGILSPENGAFADVEDKIMFKGLKLATGPQTAGSIALDYFHPKMWFVGVTLNYFDNNYIDVAPLRFTQKYIALYSNDFLKESLASQEKLKGGFMLDFSIGKVLYLKNRRSLNFNVSANNLLNSKLITGGFQQARIPYDDNAVTGNVYKFPSKYYYALGANYFATVSYKF